MVYVGFWRRFAAHILDTLTIAVGSALLLFTVLFYLAGFVDDSHAQTTTPIAPIVAPAPVPRAATPMQTTSTSPQAAAKKADDSDGEDTVLGFMVSMKFIALIFGTFYHTFFVASKWQATPGKRLVGAMVVNRNGGRLPLWHSLLRHVCCFISYITLGVGFMLIGWTREKTGLHDLICNTRVIRGEA